MIQFWRGATVAILASGPSMSSAVAARVRASGARVIAINNTWQLAPWADMLYAADGRWWDRYVEEVRDANFAGVLWTQDRRAATRYGLRYIESREAPGLSAEQEVVHSGGNGAYQAIGIAAQAGASRVRLYGLDMHGTHWHGHHERAVLGPLTTALDFDNWIPRFDRLAADLEEQEIEVINCTPGSALRCFRTDARAVA